MKAAKKRYHKKIPEFWHVLKNNQALKELVLVGYKGYITNIPNTIYCDYIPEKVILATIEVTNKENAFNGNV